MYYMKHGKDALWKYNKQYMWGVVFMPKTTNYPNLQVDQFDRVNERQIKKFPVLLHFWDPAEMYIQ